MAEDWLGALGATEPKTFTVSGRFGEIDYESLCADLVGKVVTFDGDGWPEAGFVTSAEVGIDADDLAHLVLSVEFSDGRTAEVVL